MPKNIVVIDIDGTISKVGDRLKYLQQEPKDWDSFYADCFEDEPIWEMVDLVKYLNHKYELIFCTGRRECVRVKTFKWLRKYIDRGPHRILFRKDGDLRPDVVVKPEMLFNMFEQTGEHRRRVAFILEDRACMVKKWRELGFRCLQVDEGDF